MVRGTNGPDGVRLINPTPSLACPAAPSLPFLPYPKPISAERRVGRLLRSALAACLILQTILSPPFRLHPARRCCSSSLIFYGLLLRNGRGLISPFSAARALPLPPRSLVPFLLAPIMFAFVSPVQFRGAYTVPKFGALTGAIPCVNSPLSRSKFTDAFCSLHRIGDGADPVLLQSSLHLLASLPPVLPFFPLCPSGSRTHLSAVDMRLYPFLKLSSWQPTKRKSSFALPSIG